MFKVGSFLRDRGDFFLCFQERQLPLLSILQARTEDSTYLRKDLLPVKVLQFGDRLLQVESGFIA